MNREALGLLILEASAGTHGEVAKHLAGAWAEAAEAAQTLTDAIACGQRNAMTRDLTQPTVGVAASKRGEQFEFDATPIDMVLHCPSCGLQHVDAPALSPPADLPALSASGTPSAVWDNPPHRSHLCHGCGHVWRPADVPTNGVALVKTKGKADSPIAAPQLPAQPAGEGQAPAEAHGDVLVPLTLLEDASSALGNFVSDHGWSDEDMQVMDNLDAFIAEHKANAAANVQPKGTQPVAEVRATGANSCELFFLPVGVELKPGDKLYACPVQAPAPAPEHVPVSPDVEAAIDDKLGLVLLPPIRVNKSTYEALVEECAHTGLIMQAVVRGALADAVANTSPAVGPWTPTSEALPEAGTECVVLVRGVDGKLFPALDEWEMQRESPVGWTSHTIETGLMWSGHEFEDVVAWMRVPDYAATFDVPVQGSGS